ncbi:MAG: O-antigen ligase family protein [Hyphomicrobium sp.]|jgi:O-antigen ligase
MAIICFVTACAFVFVEARSGSLSIPRIPTIVLVFFIAICVRLLLPPTGVPGAVPGAAVSRGLLLAGLFGLTLYAYLRLPFENLLWLIAGFTFACAFVALVAYVHHPAWDGRLVFSGRATHSIVGAGAISIGVIAAVALLAYAPKAWSRVALIGLILMTGVLVATLVLTGSRGPMIALALALGGTPLMMRSKSPALFIACAIGVWVLVTSIVLLDGPIKQTLCPYIDLACRQSNRHGVWMETIEAIGKHPLWGNGYGFRFSGVPHAHNAYLGVALHYGIPMLVLFVCLMTAALKRTAGIENRQQKFFVTASLVFANGFMGSDLSDPVRFFNTHYLFLWFPLFIAFVGPPPAASGTATEAAAAAQQAGRTAP